MANQIQYKIVIINHSQSSGEDFPYMKIDNSIKAILKEREENPGKYKSSAEVLSALWKTLDEEIPGFLFRISTKHPMTYVNDKGILTKFLTLTVDVYDTKTIETASKIY